MIGIIGGYGNIGIEAADIIKTNSSEMIRVAGRNISKVSQRAKELFASDKWFQIKESSSNEWKDFIKGCRLVLCSAELGNETVECINRIAGELDCPIVYLGINLPKQEAEGKFIYGAGSIPGLSGIIPQYLAQDFDSVASIDFYYGAKGTFTYTAAKDYMDGVFNNSNRSMVMWKYGKLLPYVPAEVEKTNMYICNEIENMRCFPYFDDESEYLCQKYGLSEGRWHMCISGENTLKVLERARYDYQVNKDKTLRNICRASKLDCFGTTGITKFVLTHDGYMEFVVPNCETSVETPDKKEDTHEEEIEKPIVKEIMKIWKEVFEIEDISIQDDFYTLGGDSIILMRLVDEMCKTLGCDVTVDDILQSENISDLANRV